MIALSVPSFRKVKLDETESGHFVYEVHVTKPSGREVTVERRFQEFHQFNKQVREIVNNPPHFPKKLLKPLNSSSRFLESRRAALEKYLRNLVSLIGISEVHDLLSGFLETNLPQPIRMQNLDCSRTSSVDDLDGYSSEGPKLTHQPLVCFVRDPFKDNVCSTNALPDVVLQGTLEGLYGSLRGS